jgi:hypothetical protein
MTTSKPKLTDSRCQCCGCGGYFNAVFASDGHRTGTCGAGGTRRCLTPEQLTAKGWLVNEAGFWITKLREPQARTGAAGAALVCRARHGCTPGPARPGGPSADWGQSARPSPAGVHSTVARRRTLWGTPA